jgi:hypothetical protein
MSTQMTYQPRDSTLLSFIFLTRRNKPPQHLEESSSGDLGSEVMASNLLQMVGLIEDYH